MSNPSFQIYQAGDLKSEMLVSDLLDKLTQGFCVFDGAHRLVRYNGRYAEIYDIAKSDLRPGMLLSDVVDLRFAAGSGPVIHRERYMEWREQIADEDAATETIVRLSNGKTIEIQHQPLPDGGWVSTHHDISKRLDTEACLREQTTILQAILTSTRQAVLLVDGRGTVQAFSERAIELLGLDRAALAAKPSFWSLALAARAVAPGSGVAGTDGRGPALDEPDGRRAGDLVRLDGRLLETRQDTAPNGGTLFTYTDVTDHLAELDALRRENEHLRSILDEARAERRSGRPYEACETRV